MVSDLGDIQNLWSPSQDLSNDVLYLGLSGSYIISTCLSFRVWDGIKSPESVRSWWYSASVISMSKPFEWCIICRLISKFFNLDIVKALLIVPKTMSSINSIFHVFPNQANFRKSLNMWRLWNQRIFELQKSILYRGKGLEKCYRMMIFSETWTETIPSENPKNPDFNPKTWNVNEQFLIKMTYYISLERPWKMPFIDNFFKNINLNLTIDEPPKTLKLTLKLGMSMKKFK